MCIICTCKKCMMYTVPSTNHELKTLYVATYINMHNTCPGSHALKAMHTFRR